MVSVFLINVWAPSCAVDGKFKSLQLLIFCFAPSLFIQFQFVQQSRPFKRKVTRGTSTEWGWYWLDKSFHSDVIFAVCWAFDVK